MTDKTTYYPADAVDVPASFAPAGVLTDPTTVVFRVRKPDETLATYVFGVDANVKKVSVGVYTCRIGPSLAVGDYRCTAIGTGTVEMEVPFMFVVEASVTDTAPAQPSGPTLGPCQPWIVGADVAAAKGIILDTGNGDLLEACAFNASSVLFEVSGRQFTGQCTRTVRPTRDKCQCWGPSSLGLGPWAWSSWPSSGAGYWGWRNEAGDQVGCEPMSRVRLAGWPVRKIVSVTIDGVAVPEFDALTGARSWRLDGFTDLVRMDAPGVAGAPATKRYWPSCQNMSLDSDQPGTFQVVYEWGQDVPQLGRDAAVELAQQLFLAFNRDDNCKIPAGATRVVRQGITVERGLLANWFDPKKGTGLVNLDAFLAAYWPTRGQRRPAIWSPDLQEFAREVGSV